MALCQVLKCVDHKTGSAVAVKIVRSRKRFLQQGLIEVKLLEHLRKQASTLPPIDLWCVRRWPCGVWCTRNVHAGRGMAECGSVDTVCFKSHYTLVCW